MTIKEPLKLTVNHVYVASCLLPRAGFSGSISSCLQWACRCGRFWSRVCLGCQQSFVHVKFACQVCDAVNRTAKFALLFNATTNADFVDQILPAGMNECHNLVHC